MASRGEPARRAITESERFKIELGDSFYGDDFRWRCQEYLRWAAMVAAK